MSLTDGALMGRELAEEHILPMDSDHDLLIRLSERMQQVLNDRLELNTRIAKIELALEALQRERAALKFGWRMLIGIATTCGTAAGFLAHFLLHR